MPLTDTAIRNAKPAAKTFKLFDSGNLAIAQALMRLMGRALRERWHLALAVAGFVALFLFDLPFPLVILAAAIVGAVVAGGSQDDVDAVDVLLIRESVFALFLTKQPLSRMQVPVKDAAIQISMN